MALDKRIVAILIVLATAAAGALLYITRLGMGLSFDPVVYLTVARNILAGRGITQGGQVLTHFPPLYPLLLALSGRVAGELDLGARLLHALLWGANTLVVGLIVYRTTSGRAWPAILASALMLLSPVMFEIHASALSEPTFLLLALLSLWLLQRYQALQRRTTLWLSAVLAALAFLTRYVGGTLLVTALLWLVIDRASPLRQRLHDALQFGLVSGLPMTAWMVSGLRSTGRAANRTLYWHPVTIEHLAETLESFSLSVAPDGGGRLIWGALMVVTCLAMVACLGVALTRARQKGAPLIARDKSPLLYALFALVYYVGVVASISLFDALTPFSTRILSPVYVALLITVLASVGLLTRTASSALRTMSLLPFAALAIVYALHGVPAARDAHLNGQGWAHRRYQESEFVRYVRALPPQVPLLTNNRNMLYLLTGRSGTQLAQKYNPITLRPDSRYPRLWERSVAEFRNRDGLVVYVAAGDPKEYQLTLDELLAVARFRVLLETQEGVVLQPLRKSDSQP